jgi:hypothetical protein
MSGDALRLVLTSSVEAVVRLLLLLYDSHITFVLLQGLSLALFQLCLTFVLFVLGDKLYEVILD